jgi:alanine racemase
MVSSGSSDELPDAGDIVSHTWVEVSEERLAGNFRALAEAVGAGTEVLAVVKANAYGHGAEVCSVALAKAGAKWLGVTSVEEGALIRKALGVAQLGRDSGKAPSILVMCGFLETDVATMLQHGLTPVVWTAEQVGWLRGLGLGVHVEIDTGMGRQGVRPGAALAALLEEIVGAGLRVGGIFTHFCSSEQADSPLTRAQERWFEEAVAQAKARGLRPGFVHAGNTSSVDNPVPKGPWLHELAETVGARAMVRCGLGLYGYCLRIEDDGVSAVRAKVKPVITWKASILTVRELAEGETVGYGATFTARTPMRVALLPVGYADGLRRELSSTNERAGGWVVVHGTRAPIVGRISMDLTVVDVTGIDGVKTGDEVVLLGENITAEDHARLAGTIPYEILCGVGRR